MGKLIVIDGGDGAGKTTQIQLLKNFFEDRATVACFDFPQYERSVFGKLAGNCLDGTLPDESTIDFVRLSPYLSCLPYILDRVSSKPYLEQALLKGHVLCNRYVPSNIAYNAAKLPPEKRGDFIAFLERGEYEELQLPRPDLVIYLSVPLAIATKLITHKDPRGYLAGKTKDQYERDLAFQQTVMDVYSELAQSRKEWKIIECVENDALLSPHAISEKIKREVLSML